MSTRTTTWRKHLGQAAMMLATTALLAANASFAAAPVAKVLVLQGEAQVTHDGNSERPERFASVPLGADLMTPAGSAIGVEFSDGSYVSLGDLSGIRIEAVEPVYWAPGNPMRIRLQQDSGVALVDTTGARSKSVRVTVQSGAASVRVQRGQVRVETTEKGLVACVTMGQAELISSKVTRGEKVPVGQCRIAASDGSIAAWSEADDVVSAPVAIAVAPSAALLEAPPVKKITKAPSPVKKKPAPAVAKSVPSSGSWAVVLFSLVDKGRAEAAVGRLKQDGYAAEVREQTVSGVTRYRVLLPGNPTKPDAQKVRAAVKSDLGIRDAWLLQEN